MSLRVLILAAEYPHQDKERDGIFIQDQAFALNRHGIRADVAFVEPRSMRTLSLAAVAESHFQMTTAEEDGIFTLRKKGWNPWMNSLCGGRVYAHWTAALASHYIARYGRPDVIHAHNTFWAGCAARSVARRYGIPYLVTEHSSRFVLNSITERMAPYARTVLSSADATLGVSRAVCLALRDFGAKNTAVVPNVVDTDYFGLPPVRRRRQPFTFLAVGNMNYNKGFHVLIRAYAEKFRGCKDVRLVVGGEGPQREEFQNLSRELGVSDVVTFTGALGRSGVREAMWNADTLVLPSFRETFGVVLIEALATGIPVIAAKSGGPQDIVTPEVGILVEPGSEQELVAAMDSIRGLSFCEQELRRHAVDGYGEEALVRRLAAIYDGVTGKTPK